jgi:hypothetical protein
MTFIVPPVEPKDLLRLKADANLTNTPTALTWHARMAPSGEGTMAGDWADKPHRLVYNLCSYIETIEANARRPQYDIERDLRMAIQTILDQGVMNQDEQGGCVYCGNDSGAHGYAGENLEDHDPGCTWVVFSELAQKYGIEVSPGVR